MTSLEIRKILQDMKENSCIEFHVNDVNVMVARYRYDTYLVEGYDYGIDIDDAVVCIFTRINR